MQERHLGVVVRHELCPEAVERVEVQNEVVRKTNKGCEREQHRCEAVNYRFDRPRCARAAAPQRKSQEGVEQTEARIPSTMQVTVESEE